MTLFQSVLLHTPTGVMSKRFGAPLVISSSDKRTVMTKDGGAAASAGTGSLCNRRSGKHWQMAVLRNRSAVLRRVKSEPFLNSSISLVEDGGVNNSECQPRCHYVRQMVPFNELTGEFAHRCYNNSAHTSRTLISGRYHGRTNPHISSSKSKMCLFHLIVLSIHVIHVMCQCLITHTSTSHHEYSK